MAQQTPRTTSDVAVQARGGAVKRANKNGSAADRSMPEIVQDIEVTRERLAGTVDQIADRVSPKSIANRAKTWARAQVIDADTGQPRLERIGPAVGIVVAIVGVRVWRSRRASRASRSFRLRR